MDQRPATDDICVRLLDLDTGEYITAYHTSKFSETLKMYEFARINEIPVIYRDRDTDEAHERFISDIEILFGSNDNLLSINLYCS